MGGRLVPYRPFARSRKVVFAPCDSGAVVAYTVLYRLEKARRPLAAARNLEVGGSGGLGRREEQRPARAGRAGPPLRCGRGRGLRPFT